MRASEIHFKLKNGKGKCSVPMWRDGLPAGFCNEDAYGEPTIEGKRRYTGFVPGLACYGHGGPKMPVPELKFRCPGFEIEPTIFSGCDSSKGNDCPICLGTGYIINCPVCGEAVKYNGTCKQGCWYPLEDFDNPPQQPPETKQGRE